ncbi:MAG: hypothetical protein ACRC9K_05050 [Afipia sp.]
MVPKFVELDVADAPRLSHIQGNDAGHSGIAGKETNPMTGPKKKDKTKDSKRKAPADPTQGAPFKVDPDSDDFATPRIDLSEDELKEQEDRRS